MLSLFPEIKRNGIDFIDIGCSGQLDKKWGTLLSLLNYVGFDPNKEECKRLSSLPSPYRKTRYIPYAIGGEIGEAVMYLTESPYCSSLLKPRHEWLRRFSYYKLFKEIGTSIVPCMTLDYLSDNEGLRADIIKIDSQGIEMPILKSAKNVLKGTIFVETETGFVENYQGETTYAEIDQFMRSKGFILYDITIHRIGRNNSFSKIGKHQPLWCEAIWLYDFIGQQNKPSKQQALKSLLICKTLKYFDYAHELLKYFEELNILDKNLIDLLRVKENWINGRNSRFSKIGRLFSCLPDCINKELMRGLKEVLE